MIQKAVSIFPSIQGSRLHTANLPVADSNRSINRRTGSPLPFVTITRQVAAGGFAVPQRLAKALGDVGRPDHPGWSAWDRELIEKVAADHRIPVDMIESLERPGHSWLDTFFSGLVDTPDEIAILHRVQEAVRALAKRGHAILVGHGSAFMTRSMPGGVHIRLVAPLEQRVQNISRQLKVSTREAARRLAELERNRRVFLKRFWPGQSVAPETFAATFNTAVIDEDHLVNSIVSLVPPSTVATASDTGREMPVL